VNGSHRKPTIHPISTDKAKKLNSVMFTREKSELLSTKAEQLEWHRSKVVEMRARGLSYAEIARELQVPEASNYVIKN
jgi:DNA-directed RNA polymerase specialized sigma24 family protein